MVIFVHCSGVWGICGVYLCGYYDGCRSCIVVFYPLFGFGDVGEFIYVATMMAVILV